MVLYHTESGLQLLRKHKLIKDNEKSGSQQFLWTYLDCRGLKITFKEFFHIELDNLWPPTMESENSNYFMLTGLPSHHAISRWDF